MNNLVDSFLENIKTIFVPIGNWIISHPLYALIILLIFLLIEIIILLFQKSQLHREIERVSIIEERKLQHKFDKLIKDNQYLKRKLKKLEVLPQELDTLQKKNEQQKIELKKLQQLKKAIETMNLGVSVTDTDGNIRYLNKTFAVMHGYDNEELINSNMKLLIPDVLGEVNTLENIENWQDKAVTKFHQKKDESLITVQTISTLVADENNDPQAIVSSTEDITVKTRSEKALRKSEENFRRIFQNIQDIYYEVDIDGKIKEISSSVKHLTGKERKEMLGQRMTELYSDDSQRDAFISALKKDIRVNDFEINLKGKNNEIIPCTITAKLMLEDGIPSRIIGSIRNITERKKAEQKTLKTLRELQIANKELTDFAYITSHDLKAPLRAINTIANWVMMDNKDKFDDDTQEQMELLIGRVGRMHKLIEGIYEFTNINNYQAQIENIDVEKMLQKIIEEQKNPNNYKIELKGDFPFLTFEKIRLQQLFENLINNAVKFMDKNDGKIIIETKSDEEFRYFFVTDNGPGIEKKYYKKVFQMFQTLQARDEMESTGIGLPIVKKIVEKYKGKIELDSEPGKFTSIKISLPRNLEQKNV